MTLKTMSKQEKNVLSFKETMFLFAFTIIQLHFVFSFTLSFSFIFWTLKSLFFLVAL